MRTNKLLLLFFLVSSFSISAQNSEAGGPPKLSELIGFWKKVDAAELEKLNTENPWPQKFQWFAFDKNGKVYSMMSTQDANYTSKQLQKMFAVLPFDKTPDYKLDGQFLTIDNKEIENYQEVWGVNLFTKDLKSFIKKGNLIMSLDDGNGQVLYYRLLEKIK